MKGVTEPRATIAKSDSPSSANWDEEILLCDGDLFFADLLRGLDSATNSIDFETYIFAKSRIGDRVTQALIRAQNRGVQVRVMIDGVGSPNFWGDYGAQLQQAGVMVKLFRLWPWQFPRVQGPLWRRLSEAIRRVARINRGTHRKYAIVDNSVAWLGSFNVSDVHLGEVRGATAWLDAGVRIRGQELRQLTTSFSQVFSRDVIAPPSRWRRPSLLILNSAFLLRRRVEHHHVRRLKRAMDRIWIQTPYFVPTISVYRALLRAAKRGVDVRLLLPAESDVHLIRYMSHAFYWTLLKAGVRIFEYTPRFAHQKILQVDNWVALGSSNLNHRSFLHDLEVDVVVSQPENREFLRRKFLLEQESAREISLEHVVRRPWPHRWASQLLLMFKYWF